MYCGMKRMTAKCSQTCEDCGANIKPGEEYYVALYDIEPGDGGGGYGSFDEVPICTNCAEGR